MQEDKKDAELFQIKTQAKRKSIARMMKQGIDRQTKEHNEMQVMSEVQKNDDKKRAIELE